MAITNARILIRRGLEADFNPDGLQPGEWALSVDRGKEILRVCVSPGEFIRIATYESFEKDMAQIEAILEECKTIEEAVTAIQSEINAKEVVFESYVQQAKGYSETASDEADRATLEADRAKTEADRASSIANIGIATTEKAGIVKPDGSTITVDADGTIHSVGGGGTSGTTNYELLNNKPSINNIELSGNKTLSDLGIASADDLEEINSKVDTIIEKAELNIKNTASGEEIYLFDSANGKPPEFHLFGKATQKTTSGKNLLKNSRQRNFTSNGVTFTINEDGSVTANGTATALAAMDLSATQAIPNGTYILSGCPIGGGVSTYGVYVNDLTDTSLLNTFSDHGANREVTIENGGIYRPRIIIRSGVTVNNLTFYPMISLAGGEYEPYTGGIASPNPDYPQEIDVAGASGSVEVKSCGKNLLKSVTESQTINGVEFTVNDDGSITANGTATAFASLYLKQRNNDYSFPSGSYIMSGCPSGGSTSTYYIRVNKTIEGNASSLGADTGNGLNVEISEDDAPHGIFIGIIAGVTVSNLTFYPMLRLASDTDDTYEPYKETTSTIPTPNGLPGIPVSSGGNYTDENGQQWICDEVVKYADGSGKRVQRIGEYVFDDTVTFYKSEAIFYTNVATDRSTTNKIAMCTNHINVADSKINNLSTANEYLKDGEFALRNAGIQDFYTVYFKNSTIETTEDFKAMMLSAELYYELAEPIRTPLTAEEIAEIEKLRTFYPVTNISNDADCGMSVTYLADAKNYIDNRLALIESAMINNI